jgi:hypothetical protein
VLEACRELVAPHTLTCTVPPRYCTTVCCSQEEYESSGGSGSDTDAPEDTECIKSSSEDALGGGNSSSAESDLFDSAAAATAAVRRRRRSASAASAAESVQEGNELHEQNDTLSDTRSSAHNSDAEDAVTAAAHAAGAADDTTSSDVADSSDTEPASPTASGAAAAAASSARSGRLYALQQQQQQQQQQEPTLVERFSPPPPLFVRFECRHSTAIGRGGSPARAAKGDTATAAAAAAAAAAAVENETVHVLSGRLGQSLSKALLADKPEELAAAAADSSSSVSVRSWLTAAGRSSGSCGRGEYTHTRYVKCRHSFVLVKAYRQQSLVTVCTSVGRLCSSTHVCMLINPLIYCSRYSSDILRNVSTTSKLQLHLLHVLTLYRYS